MAGIHAGQPQYVNRQEKILPGIQAGRIPANDQPAPLSAYQTRRPLKKPVSKAAWGKGLLVASAFAAAAGAAWWLWDSLKPAEAPWVYAYNAETYIDGLGIVKQVHTTAHAQMKLVAEHSCDNECFSLHVYFSKEAAGESFPYPSEEKVSRVFREHLQGKAPVKINYYYPMQYQGDIERSEVHSRLSYSALADMGYSSIPNPAKPNLSDRARAEINRIWENNPNARLEFCYYHSAMPTTYTDYTVHWYGERPAGAEPRNLAPDNILRKVGPPRIGCERKFPG